MRESKHQLQSENEQLCASQQLKDKEINILKEQMKIKGSLESDYSGSNPVLLNINFEKFSVNSSNVTNKVILDSFEELTPGAKNTSASADRVVKESTVSQ